MFLALLSTIGTGQIASAPTPISEMVAGVKTAAPGKSFQIALHLQLPNGWHNYYSNPGESGMPTTIDWTLPPGWKAGPIEWPTPHRIVFSGIPNYGYEGSVWLFTTITPASKAKLGAKVSIGAKAAWLLCSDVCVPQKADLHVSLSVGLKALPNKNPGFSAALSTLPQPKPPFSLAVMQVGPALRITAMRPIGDGEKVEFFPADPDFFSADLPMVSSVAGGFTVSVPLSKYAAKAPRRLTGILEFPAKGRSYWIDSPVTS